MATTRFQRIVSGDVVVRQVVPENFQQTSPQVIGEARLSLRLIRRKERDC